MHKQVVKDIQRMYDIHVVQNKQTYHEFCRTVAMHLGWPTQRVYRLIKPWFPGDLYNGEESIYERMHQFGF